MRKFKGTKTLEQRKWWLTTDQSTCMSIIRFYVKVFYVVNQNYLVTVFSVLLMQVAYLLSLRLQPFYSHIAFGPSGIPEGNELTSSRHLKEGGGGYLIRRKNAERSRDSSAFLLFFLLVPPFPLCLPGYNTSKRGHKGDHAHSSLLLKMVNHESHHVILEFQGSQKNNIFDKEVLSKYICKPSNRVF